MASASSDSLLTNASHGSDGTVAAAGLRAAVRPSSARVAAEAAPTATKMKTTADGPSSDGAGGDDKGDGREGGG